MYQIPQKSWILPFWESVGMVLGQAKLPEVEHKFDKYYYLVLTNFTQSFLFSSYFFTNYRFLEDLPFQPVSIRSSKSSMKNKSHLKVAFKWSRVDEGLLLSAFSAPKASHVYRIVRIKS